MALCIKQLSEMGKRIEKIEQSQGTSHDDEYNPQALGLPIETIAAYQLFESDETRLEQLVNDPYKIQKSIFLSYAFLNIFIETFFGDCRWIHIERNSKGLCQDDF